MKLKFFILALVPFLGGCASYRASRLSHLKLKPVPKHEDISFAAKTFQHSDCHTYLGRDVISAGYTPIQIALKNGSRRYLDFSASDINLKTVSANIVAESVYFSVLARAMGYGAPAGIVLGAALIPGATLLVWPLIIPSLILAPFLIIPAIVDPIWAAEANEQILRDYLEKAIQDKTIIPGSSVEGLIFVPNNSYQNNIEVTLVDRDSQENIICKSYL